MQFNIAWRVLIKRLKAIRFMMADRSVPKRKKALVVFGIIYVLFPLVQIAQPFGIISDILLWIWILWHLRDTLDTYWFGEKTTDYSKKFAGRDTINAVDFDVKYDGEEKSRHDDGGRNGH
ncbi:MAG: hypothetical protein VZQ84_03745 [Anaerovoracaceae bacterium]|nr:hypothetical protein [Anaerovoracaceae bacterium]